MKLSELNLTELAALNQCCDIMEKNLKDVFEIFKGNHYNDTFNSELEIKSIVSRLNHIKQKKVLIINEIEKRLTNVEE